MKFFRTFIVLAAALLSNIDSVVGKHNEVCGVENIKNVDYHYCSTSREFEHMCGKEGKLYEKKI